jgi:hypothetical protein
MNDPHVEALHYVVEHGDDVEYEKAPPLEHDTSDFVVRIENNRVRVTLISHYPTEADARAAVEPILRAWEIRTALEFGPGRFGFKFARSEIVDRQASAGAHVLMAGAGRLTATGMVVRLRVGRSKYPDPPTDFAGDISVEYMFERYRLYFGGGTTLADAANFCLTVLETSAGGRTGAGKRYAIAKKVLSKLGELAAKKGGNEARKADGAQVAFSATERHWLEETMKRIILRAGEVAADPSVARPQIAMSNLPPL